MKARTVAQIALGVIMLVLPAMAQEGHPMSGSWVGDWGPT